MNTKKAAAIITLIALAALFSLSLVSASNFDAINVPIIVSYPPQNANIITQGQGDVHTPISYSNYYNVNWALTTNNGSQLLYVWNSYGTTNNGAPFDFLPPFAIGLLIAFAIFMVFIFLVGRD